MSRLSNYAAPFAVTLALSVGVPVVYMIAFADSPAQVRADAVARPTGLYIIESPMGSWLATNKPRVHLNGTVTFQDFSSRADVTIDNGGVVIRPQLERDK